LELEQVKQWVAGWAGRNLFHRFDFLSSSRGSIDSGQPLITDRNGKVDNSFLSISSLVTATGDTRYVKQDGSTPLTGEWDIGEDMAIRAERLEARDAEGLILQDDGGNTALIVHDGGRVSVGSSNTPLSGVALGVSNSTAKATESISNVATFGTSDAAASQLQLLIQTISSATAEARAMIVQSVDQGAGFLPLLLNYYGGKVAVGAGASQDNAAVGGLLYESHVAVGQVGAGPTTLASYTIPIDTLSEDGQSIGFEVYGAYISTTSGTVTVAIDGNTLVSMNESPVGTASWYAKGRIMRRGSTDSWCFAEAASNRSTFGPYVDGSSPTLDWSTALDLTVTSQSTNPDDDTVSVYVFMVRWDNANS
jgi:hypothetical protein